MLITHSCVLFFLPNNPSPSYYPVSSKNSALAHRPSFICSSPLFLLFLCTHSIPIPSFHVAHSSQRSYEFLPSLTHPHDENHGITPVHHSFSPFPHLYMPFPHVHFTQQYNGQLGIPLTTRGSNRETVRKNTLIKLSFYPPSFSFPSLH